ncbi:MAG TPA: hypothetical protein VGE01_09275 [Fimbriimonas sp.]
MSMRKQAKYLLPWFGSRRIPYRAPKVEEGPIRFLKATNTLPGTYGAFSTRWPAVFRLFTGGGLGAIKRVVDEGAVWEPA